MFDGWGRLDLSEAPSEGQWSGFEESVVMWPNENLGPRNNNYGKAETKYRQLDMRTLVAGELNIVCDCGVSMREREARLRLLSDVNFYSAHYQWSALLKFHAAVLSEVERGRMTWGDNYSRLEQQMLMPFPLGKGKTERRAEKGPGSGAKAVSGSGRNEDRVLYCAEFQNNACHFHNDHGGQFFGQQALFQHTCGVCWKKSKVRAQHPASSVECPNYEPWLNPRNSGDQPRALKQKDRGTTELHGEPPVLGSVQEPLELHERVKSSGCPNYMGVRVPVRSRWKVQYMEQALDDYDDNMVVTFCRFGWPIELIGMRFRAPGGLEITEGPQNLLISWINT